VGKSGAKGGKTLASLAFLQSKRKRPTKPKTGSSSGSDVLEFLANHELSDSPENYAVIHRYLNAPDDLPSKALDALLMSGAALTDAGLAELNALMGKGAPNCVSRRATLPN